MDFFRRARVTSRRLGVFSGAFHPPTRAHLGLANSALGVVDEVLFVLPRTLPHKEYDAVGIDDRAEMLVTATAGEQPITVAVTRGGLFLEIAAECSAAYGSCVELDFLCGRDAAERVVHWDYGALPPIERQLKIYHLLVAARAGEFTPPPECAV